MKKSAYLLLLLLIALTSCDSPRSQRAISSYSNNQLQAGNNSGVNFTDNSNTNTNTNTNTNNNNNNNTTTTTNSNVPSDATQCKFSTDGLTGFESTSTHLGDYTLCQSSGTDKTIFYFQLKTPPTNASGNISVCLIPTTSSGTQSIYVGNPMCGYFTDPKSVRKITFIKYAQYANATINGVIFFKDLSWYYPVFNSYMYTLDAYKTCMNMLAYGNTAYCESFKNVGQYVYKSF